MSPRREMGQNLRVTWPARMVRHRVRVTPPVCHQISPPIPVTLYRNSWLDRRRLRPLQVWFHPGFIMMMSGDCWESWVRRKHKDTSVYETT